MSLKVIFLILYALSQSQGFRTSDLEVIKSITDVMSRKQIIIIKNISKDTNYNELLNIIKYFSNNKIYTLFRSVKEMHSALGELVSYGYRTYKYNSRTMALINDDELLEMAKIYFNVDYDAVIARIPWISFHPSTKKLMEKINKSYIPHNCQFLIVNQLNNTNYDVQEIYKINPHHTVFQVTHFGTWSYTDDLIVPINDFYSKRFNFNGSFFGIVTTCFMQGEIFTCPYIELNIFDEIVTGVAKSLNFRYNYFYTGSNISLSTFKNDHPDAPVEFFFNLVPILHSASYNPYLIPLWSTRAYLHVGYNSIYEKGMSSPFVRPFTKRLWLSIGIWILISTSIMIVISYTVNRCQKSSRAFDQLLDACFMSFESFTNQCGSETTPKTDSYRIATFMILIPPLFLVLAYSGIIISFITVRIIQFPFQNLEEFIQDGTFKMGYTNHSFPKTWFQSTKDPVARLAYDRFSIDEENMPITLDEGINKMCNNFKFSYIHFNDILFEYTLDCQPLQIPTPLFTANIALGMRPFSPFKNIFTRMFNSIRSSGIMNVLRKRVYYINDDTGLLAKNTKDFLKTRTIEIDTVDWDAVESIYTLLGIAYLISIIILLIERCFCQRFSEKFIFQKSQDKFISQNNTVKPTFNSKL